MRGGLLFIDRTKRQSLSFRHKKLTITYVMILKKNKKEKRFVKNLDKIIEFKLL